jgi:translation initiation factor 1 (eIF-1/SUI1)
MNKQMNSNSDDSDDSDSDDSDKNTIKIIQKNVSKNIKIKSKKALKHLEAIKQINTVEKKENIVEVDKQDEYLNNNINDFPDFHIVSVRVMQRNARKFITTIEDIPDKFLIKEKLDTFLITLRNSIASRATLKEKNNIKYIEVSGNKIEIIVAVLKNYLKCSDDMIRVHGN